MNMSLFEPRTLAKGIYFCIQNARDLIEEAKILYHHGRHARAFSLSILALEELGKVEIITRYYLSPDSKKRMQEFVKDFKSHSSKQLTAILVHFANVLVEQGEEELRKKLETPSERKRTLNILKQEGFYVDVVGDDFKSPRTFDGKLARELIEEMERQVCSYEELIGEKSIESFLVEIKQYIDEGGKLPEPAEEFQRIIRDVQDSQK